MRRITKRRRLKVITTSRLIVPRVLDRLFDIGSWDRRPQRDRNTPVLKFRYETGHPLRLASQRHTAVTRDVAGPEVARPRGKDLRACRRLWARCDRAGTLTRAGLLRVMSPKARQALNAAAENGYYVVSSASVIAKPDEGDSILSCGYRHPLETNGVTPRIVSLRIRRRTSWDALLAQPFRKH